MWTEVTTRAGHRAWAAWDPEQADDGAVVMLEHGPEWVRPWIASAFGPRTREGFGVTPEEALRKVGCGLTPPDTEPRTSRRDAERPEQDDRPVALPLLGGGLLLASDVVEVGNEARTYGEAAGVCTHVRTSVGSERLVPLPRATVVKALGWRAVEVSRD